MNRINNYEQLDFVDELLRAIENDCEREIMRVVKIDEVEHDSFSIMVVFTDYTILEAQIKITTISETIVFQITGKCY